MKIKKLLFLIIIVLFYPTYVFALDYPEINSKVIEIYDLTNEEVVYEVDSTKQTSIASLTKIVTTITAIETIENLDEEVRITYSILNTVPWDASKAGLDAGDVLTYRDLLYASMLPSGADATNSIAILSSGSIDNFVVKMNELVSRLGLENTHFVNVTGLDEEGHYSTADEIRKILAYALKNELFRQIYTTREYTLSNGLEVKSTIYKYSANASIDTSNILGSKTGYTGEAGYCLSSLSNINSHEFIIIVLNAEHIDYQYYNIVDSVNLINFLLEHFKDQVLVEKNTLIQKLPVEISDIDTYEIYSQKDITLYLPDDYDKSKLKIDYDGLEELSYRNKKGDKIGTITYTYDGKEIGKESIQLNQELKFNLKKFIHKYLYYIIGIISILILFIILLIRKKKKK
jgi:D-alanyl-D-alanine carboxypeptidase (penicillin-binding protein 5/6)